MKDFTIWNNWYNQTKSHYNDEQVFIESNFNGGKLFPIENVPLFLKYLLPEQNEITLRDLRYFCMSIKPPHFEVDEKLSSMFLTTNNKVYLRELPFDCFFIDVNLGEGYKGLLIHKTLFEGKEDIQIHYRNEEIGFFGEIRLNQYFINLNKITMVAYNSNGLNLLKDKINTKQNNTKAKLIIIWVCNFLDAINHPDVEIIEVKNKFNNDDKRIKRGKAPMPSSTVTIKVKGK